MLGGSSPVQRRQATALTNLAANRTALIGRDTDVEALRDLVLHGDVRLVSLTGTGGSGKTSVALRVAGELVPAFADGVWLVELAPLADAALVPQAIASALGVREEPDRPLIDALAASLAPRALLLVLDNCEHLIDACARLAETLLGACPALRILATS